MTAKLDPTRLNTFAFPHKGFRFMWAETVQKIGNVNYHDEESLKKLAEEGHNDHESHYWAPLLKVKGGEAAKVVDEWIKEHDDHIPLMKEIGKTLDEVVGEKDIAKRGKMVARLYVDASNFLEEDLKHMRWEESVVMAQYQAHFTEQEIIAMQRDFTSKMDPKEMQAMLPIFLRAGNIDDRTFMLQNMKRRLPPQAFEGALNGLVASIVPAAELDVIKQRLAAPPAQS